MTTSRVLLLCLASSSFCINACSSDSDPAPASGLDSGITVGDGDANGSGDGDHAVDSGNGSSGGDGDPAAGGDGDSDAGGGDGDPAVDAGGNGGGDTDGGSAGGGGDGLCADVTLDDNTACVDFGGELIEIPMGAAIIGAGSGAGLLRVSFSQDGINMPPRLNIDYDIEAEAGELSCAVAPTILSVTTEDNDTYYASEDGGTCTLTLTATGGNVGDAVEGSFVAEVYDVLSATTVSASGTFKTSVLF